MNASLNAPDAAASPVQRAEQVIRRMIVEGIYKPGARVSDLHLSKELGIGRSHVREAFQRLIREGTLTAIPNRGAFVSRLELDELADLMEVREALEVHIIRLAVVRATAEDIARLEDMMTITRLSLVEQGGHYPVELDFHAEVAELARNSKLTQRLADVNLLLKLSRTRSGHIPQRAEEAYAEHMEVVAAIRNRDVEAAQQAMRKHLTEARRTMGLSSIHTQPAE